MSSEYKTLPNRKTTDDRDYIAKNNLPEHKMMSMRATSNALETFAVEIEEYSKSINSFRPRGQKQVTTTQYYDDVWEEAATQYGFPLPARATNMLIKNYNLTPPQILYWLVYFKKEYHDKLVSCARKVLTEYKNGYIPDDCIGEILKFL